MLRAAVLALLFVFLLVIPPLHAATIYRCLFDKISDQEDENGFPDNWTRKSGIENGIAYPHYLDISIAQHPNPFSNYALRFSMDGGAAAVFSPKIPVKTGMSYIISAYVETQNIVFDEASVQVSFFGKGAVPLKTVSSRGVQQSNGWQRLEIGAIVADGETLQVGLNVKPATEISRHDYKAVVCFANLEIKEIPTVSLETAQGNHLFFSPRDIAVQCRIQGLDGKQHSVQFTLEDPFGKIIAQREEELMVGHYSVEKFVKINPNTDDVIRGMATWKGLPIRSSGFYRVRIQSSPSYIKSLQLPPNTFFEDQLADVPSLTFAVVNQSHFLSGGEFGWTLDGWQHDEIRKALPVLAQSGLAQLKIPFRSEKQNPQHPQHAQYLIDTKNLCSQLTDQQVRLIGIVPSVETKGPVAQRDANVWAAGLQPILTTLSLSVKDWQWSSDTDTMFADLFTDANGKPTADGQLRFQTLQRLCDPNQFGFDIGFAWDQSQDLPAFEQSANLFIVIPPDNTVTPEDLYRYVMESPRHPYRIFASISPLPKDDYDLESRIIDFVKRIVLLKAAGLNGIFLTQPKDEQTGVLRNDNSPNEIFLLWRTSATLLSGCPFIGSITLPGRSTNYCFEQGNGKCLMVVWNTKSTHKKPIQDAIFLGNDAKMIDVWGKPVFLETENNKQKMTTSPVPVFITDIDLNIVKYHLGLKTDVKRISAIPDQTHTIPFKFQNPSNHSLSVQITPQPPREGDWLIEPPSQTLNLEPGTSGESSFRLTLTARADTGLQLFHYDVAFVDPSSTSGNTEFSVFDEMQIGNPDIYMDFVSSLDEQGNLEIIQTFNNNTEKKLTYDCRLTIPGRPTARSRIIQQGFGRWEYTYLIRRGEDLIRSGVKEMKLNVIPLTFEEGEPVGEPMLYTIPVL